MKPPAAMSREERWEQRRRQKLGMQTDLRPPPAPFPEAKPAQLPSFSPPQPSLPAAIQPLRPDPPYAPPTEKDFRPSFQPAPMSDPKPLRPAPEPSLSPEHFPPSDQSRPPDSFFTNPISDQDLRRRQVQSDYRIQAQELMAQPRPSRRLTPPDASQYVPAPREERVSRSQIPMMDQRRGENEQKRQYQQELLRQMKENEDRKRQKEGEMREEGEGFFKFGRPGAGAPNRDAQGNIIATRAPKYNENDPRFLNPGRGNPAQGPGARNSYPEARSFQPDSRYLPPGYTDMPPERGPAPYPDPGRYAPPAQFQSNPDMGRYPPSMEMQYQDAGRLAPPQGYQDAGRVQPPQGGYTEAGRFPPQQGFPEGSRYPQPAPQGYPEAPDPMRAGRYSDPNPPFPDSNSRFQPPLPPEYPPGPQGSPPRPSPLVGGENLMRLEGDYENVSKARQKGELARHLQEQIEDKKRRQEEEKRQKLLEERLEEAKLEKQRMDMEEEYRRETEKKKREFRDMQAANEAALQVGVPKGRPRRQRTPMDLPAAEPPRSPPRDPPSNFPPPTILETVQRSVPVDSAQQINSQMENELWRLRNEMVNQNNELRESLQALRQQSLQANQQRFEAVKELERVREEMRLRGTEEDGRQRELLMAIAKNPVRGAYEPSTRLPAANPLPLVLPRSNFDDPKNTLGLDYADKSLTGESKFLPVFGADGPSVIPQPPRRRENADISLASLPEFGPSNVPVTGSMALDTLGTAGGGATIGIEAINRRNEERLLALEKLEGHDEIAKLDSLLANYMEVEKRLPPKPSSGKRPSSLASRGKLVVSRAPLGSIQEAEADGSLPSLAGDSGLKPDWRYE